MAMLDTGAHNDIIKPSMFMPSFGPAMATTHSPPMWPDAAVPVHHHMDATCPWRLVWCHERCHKQESEARRRLLSEAAREAGAHLMCHKKASTFAMWLAHTQRAPFVLLTDWREVKPCMEAVAQQPPHNQPALTVVLAELPRQFDRASAWAQDHWLNYASPVCVCKDLGHPKVFFAQLVHKFLSVATKLPGQLLPGVAWPPRGPAAAAAPADAQWLWCSRGPPFAATKQKHQELQQQRQQQEHQQLLRQQQRQQEQQQQEQQQHQQQHQQQQPQQPQHQQQQHHQQQQEHHHQNMMQQQQNMLSHTPQAMRQSNAALQQQLLQHHLQHQNMQPPQSIPQQQQLQQQQMVPPSAVHPQSPLQQAAAAAQQNMLQQQAAQQLGMGADQNMGPPGMPHMGPGQPGQMGMTQPNMGQMGMAQGPLGQMGLNNAGPMGQMGQPGLGQAGMGQPVPFGQPKSMAAGGPPFKAWEVPTQSPPPPPTQQPPPPPPPEAEAAQAPGATAGTTCPGTSGAAEFGARLEELQREHPSIEVPPDVWTWSLADLDAFFSSGGAMRPKASDRRSLTPGKRAHGEEVREYEVAEALELLGRLRQGFADTLFQDALKRLQRRYPKRKEKGHGDFTGYFEAFEPLTLSVHARVLPECGLAADWDGVREMSQRMTEALRHPKVRKMQEEINVLMGLPRNATFTPPRKSGDLFMFRPNRDGPVPGYPRPLVADEDSDEAHEFLVEDVQTGELRPQGPTALDAEVWYQVLHKAVVIREQPDEKSRMVGRKKTGKRLRVQKVVGGKWAQLHSTELERLGVQEAWVLLDGAEAGMPGVQLLGKVP